MSTDITRRAILKVAPGVALAGALPVALAAAAEPDPALAAIAAWERAWLAAWGEHGACTLLEEDSPEHRAAWKAEEGAQIAVCETVATTTAGLVAQLRFAYVVFGDVSPAARGYRWYEPYSEPEAYDSDDWADGRDLTLLGSMLATARALAGMQPAA